MARCWSCGAEIPGGVQYFFTCPTCTQVEEIKSLRREAYDNLSELAGIQQRGFETLSDRLSEVATVIEWGFEEVKWQLEQQTNILRGIDHTLKTPSETRANEWRGMAEELRRRGDLPKALELFLQACEANPLDYRIYIGLAYTYLEMNQFDRARETLEKSIVHVPRAKLPNYKEVKMGGEYHLIYPDLKEHGGPFWLDEGESIAKRPEEMSDEEAIEAALRSDEDEPIATRLPHTLSEIPKWHKAQERQENYYRSYSKRLIGHIYACEENHVQAATVLKSAIELSPKYEDAHYDYAQYCALLGRKEDCLASLRKAIITKPLYFNLAQKERSFAPLRTEVDNFLGEHSTWVLRKGEEGISLAEKGIRKADAAISAAEEALRISKERAELEWKEPYEKAKLQLKVAKEKVASEEFTEFVEAGGIALQSADWAIKAKEKADQEREKYEGIRSEKVKEEWKHLPGRIIGYGVLGAIGGAIIGGIVAGITGDFPGAIVIVGVVIGICYAVYKTQKNVGP